MKTSLFIITLIVLNTTALISEPLNALVANINSWWLIGFEIILISFYFINKTVKDLQSHCEIDCNNLKLYIIRGRKKCKSEHVLKPVK